MLVLTRRDGQSILLGDESAPARFEVTVAATEPGEPQTVRIAVRGPAKIPVYRMGNVPKSGEGPLVNERVLTGNRGDPRCTTIVETGPARAEAPGDPAEEEPRVRTELTLSLPGQPAASTTSREEHEAARTMLIGTGDHPVQVILVGFSPSGQARIGVEAHRSIGVHREELRDVLPALGGQRGDGGPRGERTCREVTLRLGQRMPLVARYRYSGPTLLSLSGFSDRSPDLVRLAVDAPGGMPVHRQDVLWGEACQPILVGSIGSQTRITVVKTVPPRKVRLRVEVPNLA